MGKADINNANSKKISVEDNVEYNSCNNFRVSIHSHFLLIPICNVWYYAASKHSSYSSFINTIPCSEKLEANVSNISSFEE